MPSPKMKSENYGNFGGINTKISPAVEGPQECLNLVNFEFSSPGAWTTRYGSTQYLGSVGSSGSITGLYEFIRLSGVSMPVFTANASAFYISGSSAQVFQNGLQNNLTSFVTFVDRLFFCNGQNFMKWDGLTSTDINGASMNWQLYEAGTLPYGKTSTIYNCWLYGLPKPPISTFQGLSSSTSTSLVSSGFAATTGSPQATGPYFTAGTYVYSYAFLNDRGFLGPASAGLTVTVGASMKTVTLWDMLINTASSGVTGIFSVPASYGIGSSAISLFGTQNFPSGSYLIGGIFRDNGQGGQRFLIGYINTLDPNLRHFAGQPFTDLGPGWTGSFIGTPGLGGPISTIPETTCISPSYTPRYLEVYNNQLFMSGYSLFPSTVAFSDIGDPESIQPDSNFEVRTNDSDRITGKKAFLNSLLIFKKYSFHRVTGEDPTNFSLNQVSDQYGCISGRAIATYEQYCLFLDRKGIIRFNGANIEYLSQKVEPIFQRMNLAAAEDNAWMIHDRQKNQIWCAIPVDGSTQNNMTVIYDYVNNAWSTFSGFVPAVGAIIKADQNVPVPFYGSYSSMIFNFGSSYFGDNGAGITCLVKTRYVGDLGQSVSKLYRQLFVNAVNANGSTITLNILGYQDFGTSTVVSASYSVTSFQNRIDFGVSAKNMAFQIQSFSSTDRLTLHGFALAYRFLRNV